MNHLLYLMESAGLDRPEKIQRVCFDSSISRVLELREQIWEILRANTEVVTAGDAALEPFDFVASASMRGEDGCFHWGCRLQKALTLARYGALYARKVLIPIRVGVSPVHSEPEHDLRYGLAGTLMSFLEYRPLLETGIATLSAGALPYCREHLAEEVPTHPLIERIARSLYLKECKNFRLSFERRQEKTRERDCLRITGSEDYLPHGTLWYVTGHRLKWLPTEFRRAKSVPLVQLPRSSARKSAEVEHLFKTLAYDVTVQQYYTLRNSAVFLTDMAGEARVLEFLDSDEERASRNAILAQSLLHSVPLLAEIPIEMVVKVRQSEPEAFLQYRAAVARIIKEIGDKPTKLSMRQAREAYRDILEPEVASLRAQARSIRREGLRKMAVKVAASFVAVGLGVYGGLLPSDLATLFKVAGGVGLLSQVGEAIGSIQNKPKEVENHNLFFLLQLQREADRRC